MPGALAGNAIYGRVQQILTVSFNIKVKEMEIRELRHFAKCLPCKKCCTVLSGRVLYDPSFIHAFKLTPYPHVYRGIPSFYMGKSPKWQEFEFRNP